MRLLLIEDERKVADFIARGLRAERFAIDVADDGPSGWAMASSVDYDLIILDLMLPGVNGSELLRRLRRRGPGLERSSLRSADSWLAAITRRVNGRRSCRPRPTKRACAIWRTM